MSLKVGWSSKMIGVDVVIVEEYDQPQSDAPEAALCWLRIDFRALCWSPRFHLECLAMENRCLDGPLVCDWSWTS